MKDKTIILYVDDEPINLMLFEMNFERDFKIISASSGFDGIEKLRSNENIKIVISDMKMTGMNGIEFIKLAKKEFPNIVYFILTGYDITREIEDALKNKLIFKYFGKPFNLKEIEEAIEVLAT